jgi:hypothetical protein
MELSTRRAILLAAVGAGILPEAFAASGQQQTLPRKSDSVLDLIIQEHVRALNDHKKNNNRLTADVARRLAIQQRLIVAYGPRIGLDARMHGVIVTAVKQYGRNRVLDERPNDAHALHELAQRGLDFSDEMRQLPVLPRAEEEKILAYVLATPDFFSKQASFVAAGLDKAAESGRLAQSIPQVRMRPVMLQIPCQDCGPFRSAVTWAQRAAQWICTWGQLVPGIGPGECTLAWLAVGAAILAELGCETMNAGCGGPGNRR